MSADPVVAKHLRKLRTQEDLTQSDVARPLGVTPQLVSLWEHGYEIKRMSLLVGLAEILGVTPEQILGRRRARR